MSLVWIEFRSKIFCLVLFQFLNSFSMGLFWGLFGGIFGCFPDGWVNHSSVHLLSNGMLFSLYLLTSLTPSFGTKCLTSARWAKKKRTKKFFFFCLPYLAIDPERIWRLSRKGTLSQKGVGDEWPASTKINDTLPRSQCWSKAIWK